jgi:Flp pilus assembly protein TadB
LSVLVAAAAVGLAGAVICVLLLVEPDWGGLRARLTQRAARVLAVERAREDLAQAGMPWLPAEAWIAVRVGGSVIAGLVSYLAFGVAVLGLVGCLATYHLLGLAMEHRRRSRQLERQQALLEAIRYGASVMARGGNATEMLIALARNGPRLARSIFSEVADLSDDETRFALPDRVATLRDRLAEPLFDDLALALILHWRRGAKLVPALEAIAQEWQESVQLQRDARVMRAGVEASVMVLTILPLVFLVTLQLLSPALLQPFRAPIGQVVLGLAVLWMVLGYRVMQQMTQAPREERLRLRGTQP